MFKVRPSNKNDILRVEDAKEITSVIRSKYDTNNTLYDSYDVVSKAPYANTTGIKEEDDPFKRDTEFSRVTYIHLSIPIVNIFLAGEKLDAISKILPKHYNVYDLSCGKGILLKENSSGSEEVTFIRPDDFYMKNTPYDKNIHLIGGDAVKYLLEHLDIEERISNLLVSTCNYFFPSSVTKDKGDVGTIVKDKGDVWLLDNYYIQMREPSLIEDMIKYADKVREKLLSGDNSKGLFLPEITALLSFRDDKSRFINMVQQYIYILPLGFRPTMDEMRDPLSNKYNNVVKAQNDLKNCMQTSGIKLNNVRTSFMDLRKAYSELIYKNGPYEDEHYKPIIQILTGKTGVIRNNVQASTIDFSGRSVITVDPNMSVDTIGIPEDMAINLCELDVFRKFNRNYKNKAKCLEEKFRYQNVQRAKEILEGSYIVTGRQPTLYLLGMQAFKVKVVKGSSIVLNPLVTPAFNADFDGDQMYVNMPQSKLARLEVKKLMANVNNIFLPRDGSCHLSPRQEMIYGLYKCYNAKSDVSSSTARYENVVEFKNKILNDLNSQDVLLDDKCIIDSEEYRTVGYAALKIFLGSKDYQKVRLGVVPITTDTKHEEHQVTETFFKEYFKYLKLNGSMTDFINIVNNFVKLGFAVANLYPPDINILKEVDTSDIKEKFFNAVSEREEYYNLGFDTEESFSLFYSSEYNVLEKEVVSRVKSTLGEDNGFIQLIESGARGSKSNLLQLFGMKGTILKNQAEAFNAIITTPLSNQLSGLEHFITAYGSRQGIIDRVIGTYAPGYLSRKMSHISRHIVIESHDCGTDDGILLSYDFLKKMLASKLINEPSSDYVTIKEFTVKILEGRFITDVNQQDPLTHKTAEDIFNKRIASFDGDNIVKHDGVKLRSPITCKDQCCAKCYGTDLLTNRTVIPGTAVGFIASQSITEPMTQLIMKNFQKGGVAGNKNLTSSFDTISDLLEMYSVSKLESKDEPIIHDFISPVEGYVKLISRGDGTSLLNIISEEDHRNKLLQKVVVYDNVEFKEYVKAGESIQKNLGILDINEILKYRGFEEAMFHMLFQAYEIFENEVYVNFKHFEILVNGMILHLCTKGNKNFRVGNYYSNKEFIKGNTEGCKFIKVLRGLKQIPKIRNDFLTSIYLEDVNKTVSRNIVTSGIDNLDDPLVRITLGLDSGLGTGHNDEYLDTRGI